MNQSNYNPFSIIVRAKHDDYNAGGGGSEEVKFKY